MPRLFEIRYNDEKKYYEMMIASGMIETWVPAATHWIYYRIPFPTYDATRSLTLLEMLMMEGWTPPEV